MSKDNTTKVIVSKDDAKLWDEFSTTVNTKKSKPKAEISMEIKEEIEDKIKTKKIIAQPNPTSTEIKKAPPMPPIVIGDMGGIDTSLFQKLRGGRIKLESRRDLHAQTKEQAWKIVREWIPKCRQKNMRCIHLVTGKGTGALQESVPIFLNHPEIRPSVLCCVKAAPKHGDSGAFYIYLKRGS